MATTATATMPVFAVEEFGAPGSIQQMPVPLPDEGELLIRVHAAGVNPFDLATIAGYMKEMMEHRFPLVPGVDAAGTVEAVGPGVTQFTPGDEVITLAFKPFIGEGTYAHYVTVPAAGLVARKPAALDFTQAAALPTPGLAALQSVKAVAPATKQTVLIVGAAGGVGTFAVQLAARQGATVVATALPGQEAYLRSLGAAEVIDITSTDAVETVKATHPEGIDGLIDLVSRDGESLGKNVQVLRRGGRLATTLGAADVEALSRQGIEASNIMAAMQSTRQDLQALANLAATGDLQIPVARVYSLDETQSALQQLASGTVQGKLVLDCRTS